MKLLTESEIAEVCSAAAGWNLDRGCLVHVWRFSSFREAMEFVNRVAGMAEAANHHPDIDIRYDTVRLTLISHDAGGLTGRDARMARELSGLFPASFAPDDSSS